MNKKLLTLAISITLMSGVGTMTSAYAKNPHEYPPQCVNPATGELKPNAAHHPICEEAIKALGGDNQTGSQDSDENTGTNETSGNEGTSGDNTETTHEENTSTEITVLIISELTLEQIEALTAAEIAALTSEQLAQFSTEQIAHLSLAALVGLSAEQVPYFSVQAVAGFSILQLDALPDVVKIAFTAEQRLNMVAYIFPALSPEVTVPESGGTSNEETTSDSAASGETPEGETGETAVSTDEAADSESTSEDTASSEEEGTGEATASDEEAANSESASEDTASSEEGGTDETATDEESTATVVLPDLGTTAVNAAGESIETAAKIEGGLTSGGSLAEEVSLNDEVKVSALITVDPQHMGQVTDVVVYAAYMPIDHSLETPIYFMLDESLGIYVWDEDPVNLLSFMKIDASGEALAEIPVTVYEGKFVLPGVLNTSVGYRLLDGTLVVSNKTIDVTVTPQTASAEETIAEPTTNDTSSTKIEATDSTSTESDTSSATGTDATTTEASGISSETSEASDSSTEGTGSSITESDAVVSSEIPTSSPESGTEASTSSEVTDSNSEPALPATETSSGSGEEVEVNDIPAV